MFLTTRVIVPAFLAAALLSSAGTGAVGQQRTGWLDRCQERSNGDRVTVCLEKELTLPAVRGGLVVNAAPNGGITVTGTNRRDVHLVARLQAHARRDADARALLDRIEILTDGSIRATGPRTGNDEGWSVSFVLEVPQSSNLDLSSRNGGIAVEGVSGEMELSTTNGGLSLAAVAGTVHGRTTNGGITVDLDGDRWQGSGLDVQTTNGGVRLRVPERYNARLEAGTVNGGLSFDFPVKVEGRTSRRLTTDLGTGGPLIRVVTTNGGVTVERVTGSRE